MNPQAAEIACLALGVSAEALVGIEPLPHGLTNASWIVRTRSDAVVVRIGSAAADALQIDRASEAVVLKRVAAAGIGPPLLLCDPEQRLLVTRYLGATWGSDAAGHAPNIRRLAALLQRLHSLSVPARVRQVDLGAIVAGYLQRLDERGVAGELTLQSRRERGAQVARQLQFGSRPCLCHNDVHHRNIIDEGALRLIDWEYAGVGERLFDLGGVSVYHRYGPAQRQQLLTAYATGAAALDPVRFELACWLFDYIRELWSAVREGTA